jgi:hypothetical protein
MGIKEASELIGRKESFLASRDDDKKDPFGFVRNRKRLVRKQSLYRWMSEDQLTVRGLFTIEEAANELGKSTSTIRAMGRRQEIVFVLRFGVRMVPKLIIDDIRANWDNVLNILDTEEILGWKRDKITSWATKGQLKGEKISGSWFFEEKVVYEFMNSKYFKPKPTPRAKPPVETKPIEVKPVVEPKPSKGEQMDLPLDLKRILKSVYDLFVNDEEFSRGCVLAFGKSRSTADFMRKIFDVKNIYGEKGVCWFECYDDSTSVEVHMSGDTFVVSKSLAVEIVDKVLEQSI